MRIPKINYPFLWGTRGVANRLVVGTSFTWHGGIPLCQSPPTYKRRCQMKKLFFAFLTVLVITAFLIPTVAMAKDPVRGGTMKVILARQAANHGFPPNLAGATRDYVDPLFDRLIQINAEGEYEPCLASSWKVSPDGKTLTFNLRKGVKFHDGTDFNAAAAKWNIENLLPPNPNKMASVASVEAVDDYTLRINLRQPDSLVLYFLGAAYEAYMYSPTAFKTHDKKWAQSNPVGTGPFMQKSYNRDTGVSLVKNPNYWQKGLPYLDGIELMTVLDEMTQTTTIKAGQTDVGWNVEPATANALKNDPRYEMLSAPGSVIGMAFDSKNNKVLANPKVRAAIDYAIDREGIAKGPSMGLFPTAYQVLTPESKGYCSEKDCPPRKYNVAKAKQLLAEAGYPSGIEFEVLVLNSTFREAWEAAQASMALAGIKMKINYQERAKYNEWRAGKIAPGLGAMQTNNVFINPLLVLDYYFRSDASIDQYFPRPAGTDALLAKATASQDLQEVFKLCRQVSKILYDDVTVIPIYTTARLVLVNKKVHDIGYFIGGDANNNKLGLKTWIEK